MLAEEGNRGSEEMGTALPVLWLVEMWPWLRGDDLVCGWPSERDSSEGLWRALFVGWLKKEDLSAARSPVRTALLRLTARTVLRVENGGLYGEGLSDSQPK